MFKIIQNWWHIENKRYPSDSIVFRDVTDIYTDEQFIYYQITDYFVQLKIRSRFKNQELNFFQRGNFIQINLGNLKTDWPPSPIDNDNIRHVRLEIQYIDIRPVFEDSKFFDFIPRLGYENTYTVNGITQPEFSITVPLGMKLRKKGKNIQLLLKIKKGKNIHIFYKGEKGKNIKLLLKIKIKNIEDLRLYYEDINIDHVDGKNTYNFLIRDDSYNKIRLAPIENIEKIKVYYNVTNQFKFWIFPAFPVLMTLFGIGAYLFYGNYAHDDMVTSLTYIVIFITFLTFYLTLIKDGYEIPWNKFTIIFTPLTTALLIFPQLISIFFQFTTPKLIQSLILFLFFQHIFSILIIF